MKYKDELYKTVDAKFNLQNVIETPIDNKPLDSQEVMPIYEKMDAGDLERKMIFKENAKKLLRLPI